MRGATSGRWVVIALLGAAPTAWAQGQGTFREQLHPSALGGVIMSIDPVRQNNDVPMPSAVQLRERLGTLFAVAGFETVGAETPYALTSFVSAQPTREDEVAPQRTATEQTTQRSDPNTGLDRRVTTLVEITLQLIYRPTGEIMNEWTFVVPGIGRDRPDAIENAFRQIRPSTTRYVELAREARERVVRHADASCEELRKRAAVHAEKGAFDHAVAELMLVPDDARACHSATITDLSTLLATKFSEAPATGAAPASPASADRAMQRAAQLHRDPIRNEWPFVEGVKLTVAFVNANAKATRRGEKIW